jgi:hypothetical protein
MKAAVKQSREYLLWNSYKQQMKAQDLSFKGFTALSPFFFSAITSAPSAAAFILSIPDIASVALTVFRLAPGFH